MTVVYRRLPAEWEPQSGVQLTWPHADSDWGDSLYMVEPCFVEIARAIAAREILLIAAFDPAHVQSLLQASGVAMENVRIYRVPSTDAWSRDHSAITVVEDERPKLMDFAFNGWGGKYRSDVDNLITYRLHVLGAFGKTPIYSHNFILEGGSIETDGNGTLLTTASCLLSPTRNTDLDQAGIEAHLTQELGFTRYLWLRHGYQAGDDTDAHIDILARFCDEETIAYVACSDRTDEHFDELFRMKCELESLTSPSGKPYYLVPLPMPGAQFDSENNRLPGSYANFLIINGAVLVPTYSDPADEIAIARIAECFPNREIIAIDCRPLILQHGSLHCVTMQFPAGVLS